MSMIRGEVSIKRPVKPGVSRVNLPGSYDYDAARNKVTLATADGTKEFDVLTLPELLAAIARKIKKPE